MTPPDRHELLDDALSHARRLARGLRMMEPEALGIASNGQGPWASHWYKRDRHASALHGLIVDLEDALKKEKAA